MKPILFNTEMTRAILDGRKTQTRRVVNPQPAGDGSAPEPLETRPGGWNAWGDDNVLWPRYQPDDILYVRETWQRTKTGQYIYRADKEDRGSAAYYNENCRLDGGWRPSIHMPKEAARLFLRVTDVRVERLQDISTRDVKKEGIVAEKRGDEFDYEAPPEVMERFTFEEIWDSTIKPTDLDRYGWNANPWVWVYTFERIAREEAEAARKEVLTDDQR